MALTPFYAAQFIRALEHGTTIRELAQTAGIKEEHARQIVHRMTRENMVERRHGYYTLTKECRKILPAVLHVLTTMR